MYTEIGVCIFISVLSRLVNSESVDRHFVLQHVWSLAANSVSGVQTSALAQTNWTTVVFIIDVSVSFFI